MLIKSGSWFEIEVVSGVFAFIRVGQFSLGVGHSNKPKKHLSAYKEDQALYIHMLGREVLLSANG